MSRVAIRESELCGAPEMLKVDLDDNHGELADNAVPKLILT